MVGGQVVYIRKEDLWIWDYIRSEAKKKKTSMSEVAVELWEEALNARGVTRGKSESAHDKAKIAEEIFKSDRFKQLLSEIVEEALSEHTEETKEKTKSKKKSFGLELNC